MFLQYSYIFRPFRWYKGAYNYWTKFFHNVEPLKLKIDVASTHAKAKLKIRQNLQTNYLAF